MMTDQEIANSDLTPKEKIECEVNQIKRSAEWILDIDADEKREALVGDILDSVKSIKKSLIELVGKDQRIVSAQVRERLQQKGRGPLTSPVP